MGKQGDLPLPVAVYAVILSATYVMQSIVLIVANRKGLTTTKLSPRETLWSYISGALLPIVFLGSIPLAYLYGPLAAQRSWISLLFLYPLLGRLEKRDLARAK
jgi:hypothetical protein